MQLKGLVKIFTIALILISLFQLSFTFVVNNFEKKQAAFVERQVKTENPNLTGEALEIAKADKLRFVLDSMSSKTVMNLGLTKYSYQEAKDQQLNLGLDLQGGMNVVLEVSLDELIRNMSNNPQDPALNAALQKAKQLQVNSQDNFSNLFVKAYEEMNPNAKLAPLFMKPDGKT
ncbi:MAG: protein translocase subunit SecDF, partial [Chitinophagaceae bacterium]|nr:protein translocase subunit SecDF [Chitinophagaceae bacterium]